MPKSHLNNIMDWDNVEINLEHDVDSVAVTSSSLLSFTPKVFKIQIDGRRSFYDSNKKMYDVLKQKCNLSQDPSLYFSHFHFGYDVAPIYVLMQLKVGTAVAEIRRNFLKLLQKAANSLPWYSRSRQRNVNNFCTDDRYQFYF